MRNLDGLLLTFVLNSVWQVPMIGLVAWLASRVLANGPARQRHIIWVGAMIAASLLPLATRDGTHKAGTETYSVSQESASIPRSGTSVSSGVAGTSKPSPLIPSSLTLERFTAGALFLGWFLFVLFRLVRLVFAGVRARRVFRASFEAPRSDMLERVWQRSVELLGVRNARLRISPTICGPVMLGWRGTIILPESMLVTASEDVLAAAIGHELAHIARKDFVWNILIEILWLPIAYNPASQFMRRSVERSREIACDELVTEGLLAPATYAQSVLAIATAMNAAISPDCTLGMFDGNQLEERIRFLLNQRPRNLGRARVLFAACASMLVICILVASGIAIPARAQSAAVPEMRLAELAFNNGNYSLAEEHFRKAVDLDPANLNARLFLATAIVRGVTAGPQVTPVKLGEGPFLRAVQQYDAVLALDPYNQVALFGLATFGGSQRTREAHDRLLAFIAHEPNNLDAYYAAAVSDWSLVLAPIHQASAAANLVPGAQLPDPAVRRSLRVELMPQINEGIHMLDFILKSDANRSDALAFENILYREAALIAETPEQSRDLLAKADSFVQRALQARRLAAASEPRQTGKINVDVGPPLSPLLGGMLAPPPPPPPPPPR